jgi:large subunit ribosomal protein L23
MDSRDVIVRPILTEKSTVMSEVGKYVFRVNTHANKLQIRQAVEELFRVDVTSVNVSRVRGKWRRFGRSRGRQPDWKKAVVTLEPGQSIELFPGT